MKILPHQETTSDFLSTTRFGGDFSGMGSGKTLTALTAVQKVRKIRTRQNVLSIIILPPIAIPMWIEEYERVVGGKAHWIKKGTTPIPLDAECIVMSYTIAVAQITVLIGLARRAGCTIMITDEGHALKNREAKRTQRLWLDDDALAVWCDFCWDLTGTPETRWHSDLWPFLCRAKPRELLALIGGKELGPRAYERFELRYCVTQLKKFSKKQRFAKRVVVGNRNTDELHELIYGGDKPAAIRNELADVWASMPALTTVVSRIDLDADAELKKRLKKIEKMTQRQIQEGLNKPEDDDESLSRIRRELGEAKVKHGAQALIERAESGAGPVLVGCWHTDVINRLFTTLTGKGYACGIIDGHASGAARSIHQTDFNNGDIDFLICQLQSAGVSLNLQHGGNRIVCLEESFSPDEQDQFYARLRRMGQESDHVHAELLRAGTKLEDAIAAISSAKAADHARLNRRVGT